MKNRKKREPVVRQRSVARRSRIRAEHRKKHALVYVRTATADERSAQAQRAIAARVAELGWPAERIKIIEDLGYSGLSDGRPGFVQMQALLDAKKVGLIEVSDVSRISRDPAQLESFLRKARHARALVAVGGRVLGVPTDRWIEG